MIQEKHRYKTITQAREVLNGYLTSGREDHPRVAELEDNIEWLKARNRKRRVNPGVNLRDQAKIDARKRWIEKKRKTIEYYEEHRHENPQWFGKEIYNAELQTRQWEREIEQLTGSN